MPCRRRGVLRSAPELRQIECVFDTILGLPVHALVIHAVIVLVPLAAVGVILAALSATWRERLRTVIVVVLGLGVVAAIGAKLSGEELQARLPANPDIERHAQIGSAAPWPVLAAWIVVVAWFVADHRLGVDDTVTRVMRVLAVLAVVVAAGLVLFAGHLGSLAVWQDVIDATNG